MFARELNRTGRWLSHSFHLLLRNNIFLYLGDNAFNNLNLLREVRKLVWFSIDPITNMKPNEP
jgi:hypothetical protein